MAILNKHHTLIALCPSVYEAESLSLVQGKERLFLGNRPDGSPDVARETLQYRVPLTGEMV